MAKPGKLKPTHEEFVFIASAPSLRWSFGIQHDRRRRADEPFEETQTLSFQTECLWPDRFKGRVGQVAIFPEPGFVEDKLLAKDDLRRNRIGFVRVTKSEFETALWLPPPMCQRLADTLANGLVRSMLTNGLIESKGMNRVTSVSFLGQEFDPVAYIG